MFTKGDRVRVSPEGLLVLPNMAAKVGTVIGFSADRRCCRIMWDGNACKSKAIHNDFLQHVGDLST